MKVLVCGGRDYADAWAVDAALSVLGVTELVHGGATGADALCAAWARQRGIRVAAFRAEWGRYGRRAGPLRNQKMAQYGADVCLAFPGGRGTADMIAQAERAGIEVRKVVSV